MATRRRRRRLLGERDRTRKFLHGELPGAKSPAHRANMKALRFDKEVFRVVVLPKLAIIATLSSDGHIRIFDVGGGEGGDRHPSVDIKAHARCGYGLAALNDHVLASASAEDGRLHTWDARTGARIDTIDLRGHGVGAIAAVGAETIVAGFKSGALVFIQHTCGAQLTVVARNERAHSNWIRDIACEADVMVTASADKTARVWSLSTRKPRALLRGHTKWVWCAAISSRYIATGSADNTLRLYENGAEFPLVSALEGLHTNWICSLQFVGSGFILSGADDGTMCFTKASPDARPVARLDTKGPVHDTVVTADGQIAWAGSGGIASICAPPPALVGAAEEHALARFGPVSSDVPQPEPLPPLQGALFDVHAGPITAGEACRTLLNAERCSASISEWWCGHRLLMLAIGRGEIAGQCALQLGGAVEHDYWFKNLYLPTKRIQLGRQDRKRVDECLAEAKNAGVIEGTQAILGLIEAQLDLQEEVSALQDAGKQMLMALSIALLEQASARAELARLGAEMTRMDRVQKISLLMNAIFSVAPLAGGAAAGAGVAVFGMAPDLIESILGCGVGLQGAATPLVVDRFVRQTAQVIGSWATVPDEARKSILAAAEGLEMTWEEFCDMILAANDVVLGKGDEEVGDDGLDGVVVEEVESVGKGESDDAAVSSCLGIADGVEGMASVPSPSTGDGHRHVEESIDSGEDDGGRRSAGESTLRQNPRGEESGGDCASGRTQEANFVPSSSEVGNTCVPTSPGLSMRELESLALNADEIRKLDVEQSSCLIAAAMVMFKERYAKHYVIIERGIFRAFDRTLVDGESLVDTFSEDRVLEIARRGLNDDEEYLALEVDARTALEGRLKRYLMKLGRSASSAAS